MNAVITGASSGIGEECAYILAQKGYDVYLIARRKSELLRVAKHIRSLNTVHVFVIPADITKKKSYALLEQQLPKKIDVFINNAGKGFLGSFTDSTLSSQEKIVSLNITAFLKLSYLVAQRMRKQSSGFILHVSSIASFFPGPFMASYYASKAFGSSFSDSLREELRGTGVSVTCLCPGPTSTGFAQAAHAEGSALFTRSPLMSPYIVAYAGIRGMFSRRRRVIPGLHNKLSVFFSRFLPHGLLFRIVRRLNQ